LGALLVESKFCWVRSSGSGRTGAAIEDSFCAKTAELIQIKMQTRKRDHACHNLVGT